jgi:hypothetical protein
MNCHPVILSPQPFLSDLSAVRKLINEQQGEAIDSIAFTVQLIFFLHFQPKNRMSSPETP